MRSTTLTRLFILWFILLGAGCRVARQLPEGKYLYQGGKLRIEAPDTVAARELRQAGEEVVNEQYAPRWRVWWYYRDGFPLGWLGRRLGREPVFYESTRGRQTVALLENRALNQGHFYRLATYELDTTQGQRTITVDYELRVGPSYRMDTLTYGFRDSLFAQHIRGLSDETVLEAGAPYQLAHLKEERSRLETALREQGFYFFSANDLEYLADTLGNDHGVRLLMKQKDGTPSTHTRPQRIRRVMIYSDYRQGDTLGRDTIRYEGLHIACRECPLRPPVLDEAFAVRPDSLYSPEAHEKTVGRLFSLNTFRYISLNYQQVPGSDSLLDLVAYLTPNLRRSVAGELGAAYNSGNYFGPEIGLSYANRNLLHGAELLTLEGDLAYNFFLGDSDQSRIPRSGVYELQARLQVPRLWLPKRKRLLPSLRQSGTVMQVGGKLEKLDLNLNRFSGQINPEDFPDLSARLEEDPNAGAGVRLTQLSGRYGYTWQQRAVLAHSGYPINLRYQNPRVATEELLTLSRGLGFTQDLPGLGRLDRMLLFGPSYQLLYDSRLSNQFRWHHFFVQLDLAFNFNRVLPVGDNERELSVEKSRYFQPKVDFRYYWRLSREWTFAARVHTGVALPTTERAIVPYFDLYTVGGPNSLRGFIPRGLGPGPTVPEQNNLLGRNGYGNVLLESAVELRYRLSSLFELAAFFDAGNVWLYRTEREPVTGEFTFNRLPRQLGADAGLGLRLHLSFLTLRLDVAKPLQLPHPTGPDVPTDRKLRFVLAFGQAF